MVIKNNKQVIQIKMLGKFEIKVGNTVITDGATRARQQWNLIEYLITFRNKTISQEELVEALWPEDSIDNPASALKNLVYRARNAFASYDLPFAKDMIIYSRGTYSWNNNLECDIDAENFEQLYRCSIQSFISSKERIECGRKALDLYLGDFLPYSNYEKWTMPISSYFKTMYFKCVKNLVELLEKEEAYDEIYSICQKAVTIDRYEELPHKYIIIALAKQNNHTQALNHYNHTTGMFYRELGVKPSEDMRNLYREINKSINNIEMDLEIIKEDLSERIMVKEAYYCDYEIFKNIYRVEARTSVRAKEPIFIGLLTITDNNGKIPPLEIISAGMEKLLHSTQKNLRNGDIVARFSATQYVLMFPTLSFGSGEIIIDRITHAFKEESGMTNIKVHATIKAIDSIL